MSDNGHFAFIPKRTTHSKDMNALPVSARWLYVIMVAERGGLDASFKFPYREIRNITGFSTATIRQAVIALDKAGYLDYEHGGLEQNPNMYNLNPEPLKL
jgi:hypothetical protein